MSVVIRPMQGGKGPRVRTSEEALKEFMPSVKHPKTRPTEMGLRLASYVVKQKMRGRKKFPLVTMLEPLEACNLTCEGCGRIREYEPVLHRMATMEQCIKAVEDSGAPIISIAGGEPCMYPQLPQLIKELTDRKYFVYCCTNALLLEKMLPLIPPSKYLCWVIHLDGMEEQHDTSVSRRGVWRVAMRAAKKAIEQGYRVCCNSTLFKGSQKDDLHELYETVTKMGFEGIMTSAGYDFTMVPDQDMFLKRKESHELYGQILSDEARKKFRFYNNPLYLDFLKGTRNYECKAYANPTYTIQGWRKPCYSLASEGHVQDVNELFDDELWNRWGVGKNAACTNCMMHCGFETSTIFSAFSSPSQMAVLVKGMATNRTGVGAS